MHPVHKKKMFEHFKKIFANLDTKIIIDDYPKYYEKNGKIIKEFKNGRKITVKDFDGWDKPTIKETNNG